MSITTTKKKTNLNRLIDQAIDEATVVDPRQIATQMIASLPETELLAVVEKTLPDLIRERIRANRQSVYHGTQTTSAKWIGAANLFEQMEYVGTGWKALGDCTHADLMVLVIQYESRAQQNANEAESRRKLADLLVQRQKTQVRDLDPKEVSNALG